MSKINTKVIKKTKLNTADNLEKIISKQFVRAKDRTIAVPLLYRLVYGSKASFVTVFILLLSFVFQGASLTYADEISEPEVLTHDENIQFDTSQEVTEPEIEEIEPLVSTSAEPDSSIETIATDEQAVILQTDETQVNHNATEPIESPPILLDDTGTAEPGPDSPETSEVFPVVEIDETPTTTASSSSDSDDETEDDTEASSTPDVIPDLGENDTEPVTEVATTTDIEAENSTTTATTTVELVEQPITITNSDTEFTFNRSECTTLASGSFYCLKADAEVLEDALFSAPDIDGDLEIYLVRDGIRSQVTSNLVDDAAPFFDQNSNTIVWHRLINDRYQIISYDVATGEEIQLTKGTNNSMEPTRQGKYTVWQNWSNNNWNVVLFDGKEQKTITESSAHDIAPYVHGSLVVWNRYASGQDKTIEMFDMISETYVTVDDPEGLSVTNPRMVFVYDSLHPNGDVVTKGYDMISRKFIQLDTLPKQLPEEIPESESTGETRALIQSKPSVKSDESIHNNTATSSGPVPPGTIQATSSSESILTLDLTASSTIVAPPLTPEITTLTEYELVIPPLSLPTETVQE